MILLPFLAVMPRPSINEKLILETSNLSNQETAVTRSGRLEMILLPAIAIT